MRFNLKMVRLKLFPVVFLLMLSCCFNLKMVRLKFAHFLHFPVGLSMFQSQNGTIKIAVSPVVFPLNDTVSISKWYD